MNFLKKWIAPCLILSTAACGPIDESQSKLKMDPATLYTVAQVAFAVAGAIKGSQDVEANKTQLKRLSNQIAEARNAIISSMQDIYTNDTLALEKSFMDDLRTFEDWADNATTLNYQISRGTEIKNKLITVVRTMNTEQALRVVPALNVVVATNAALMEFRGTRWSVIKSDLMELGATNYFALEKHLPDRWYPKIVSADHIPVIGSGTLSYPGLFRLSMIKLSEMVAWRIKASRVASQSDPLFSSIVAFQSSLAQLVNIQERPRFGFPGYMVLNGNTVVKGNENGNICIFQSIQHLNLDRNGPVDQYKQITSATFDLHVNTQACKIKIPEGTFQMPGTNRVFYSNGVGAFCRLGHDAGAPMVVYNFDIENATDFAYHGNCQ
ncbi:MAG: hypothetical protein ACOH5I_06425 [Oligoflexus sp.]